MMNHHPDLHTTVISRARKFESKEHELNKSKVINKVMQSVVFKYFFLFLSDVGDPLLILKFCPWALSRRTIKSQIIDNFRLVFPDFTRK